MFRGEYAAETNTSDLRERRPKKRVEGKANPKPYATLKEIKEHTDKCI